MDAVQALIELGGVATGGEIVAQSSRRKLRTAVGSQRITRVARNSYMLPLTEFGAAAARLNGLISHASAAAHWGWKTKIDDWRPHVTVPRGRKVAPAKRRGVHLHWKTLAAAEVAGRAPRGCARSSTVPGTCPSTRRWPSPTPRCAAER